MTSQNAAAGKDLQGDHTHPTPQGAEGTKAKERNPVPDAH